MKVNAANGNEQLRKKLAEKFGDDFKSKAQIDKEKEAKRKELEKDKVELSDSAKKKAHIDPEGFGDVKNNDPNSEETKAKLQGLLKSGAFSFNDKERAALGEILGG